MKRVLKRLSETRIGASSIPAGSMVIFAKNEEERKGRISDRGTLPNGKTFYYVKDAVSDSGKVRSFDVEDKSFL
ncbi:MAG: hypothetical protein LBE10_04445 [Treponema sp.]|jgi:hypothetical protein|nr:hypothetical protein [Treponema sp.]